MIGYYLAQLIKPFLGRTEEIAISPSVSSKGVESGARWYYVGDCHEWLTLMCGREEVRHIKIEGWSDSDVINVIADWIIDGKIFRG